MLRVEDMEIPSASPNWRDAENRCALSDQVRHLGHAMKTDGCWVAYDGTRLNDQGDGFRCLGSFASRDLAKSAVEAALAAIPPASMQPTAQSIGRTFHHTS